METRTFNCEVRAEQNSDATSTKIIGSAAVFDVRSEILKTPWGEPFVEIIRPGAFDNVLDNDVRAYFNHDQNYILGRTKSGTLRLSVDHRGLQYEADAPNTQTIQDLVIAPMLRGDINQSSFAFTVTHDGDDWYYDDDGVLVREVIKVKRLFDVSPVSLPATTDTESSISTRSFDLFKQREGEKMSGSWAEYVRRDLESL